MASPKGSGYFSAIVGIAFLVALVVSFFVDVKSISPIRFFQLWLAFAALILLIWGVNRVRTGDPNWTVGQNTINFVVAVFGATIAILTLVAQAPDPKRGEQPPVSSPTAPASK